MMMASLTGDSNVNTRFRRLGSIKRLGGGGHRLLGALWGIEKFFTEMLETGGGEKIFPSYHTEIARFLPNFFKKLGNFQTKKAPLMLI
jgi:hypothetical protein